MVSSIRRALGPLDVRPQIPLTPDGLQTGLPPELRVDEAAPDPELARLERSVANVRRECAIAVLEASPRPRRRQRRLPPAAQLAPIDGIPFVHGEPVPRPHDRRAPLPLHSELPLAAERRQLPPARRQRNRRLRGALYVLVAGLIGAAIAYQLSSGGAVSATNAAHAALSAVARSR